MELSRRTIRESAKSDWNSHDTKQLEQSTLPIPKTPQLHEFEVSIEDNEIRSVYWDGMALPGDWAKYAAEQKPPLDPQGKLGIFMDFGTATIHSARIKILKKAN